MQQRFWKVARSNAGDSDVYVWAVSGGVSCQVSLQEGDSGYHEA